LTELAPPVGGFAALRGWLLASRRNAGIVVAGVVWVGFVANFAVLYIAGGDAPYQYQWVQRLYGQRAHADGYFFGLGLLEAPFYGIGRLLRRTGVHIVGGFPVEMVMVALGTGLVVVPAGFLLVRLLRALDLAAIGTSLLAAFFGTSLVFWVVFSPGKNHPADAALFTLVVYLVYRYFRGDARRSRLLWALGATLGFSITVRYFSGAEAVALVATLLAFRRVADAIRIACSTAVTCALLFAIPLALGTPVFGGGYGVSQQSGFYPLNPLRMLFTDHRGLFVWSPVTVLALAGLVLLYRRRADLRPFLVAVYAMGAAIVASYAFVPYWDGAWSFGQRYYTPLFPLVVLGLAALFDAARGRARIAVAALTVAATAWSLFLCFNLFFIGGHVYTGPTFGDGAVGVARLQSKTHTPWGQYAWSIYYRSRLVKPLVPWPFSHS